MKTHSANQVPRQACVRSRLPAAARGRKFLGAALALALSALLAPETMSAQGVSLIARRDFEVGNATRSVAVGDFDGDAVPDLAVANSGSNNVSVLLGNGDGSFQAARNFGAGGGPRSVAAGDFDGDGLPDLAVANFSSNDGSVLINNTPRK